MATSHKNIETGLGLVPNTTTQNKVKGDLETLTSDNKLHFFGASNDAVVTETIVQTLTNKTIDGTTNTITNISISSGISGLGAGVAAFLSIPSSLNLATAVTDETGTGALVFATSPILVTPNLGTPTILTLTNATGLPVTTGISGLATGISTFLTTPSSANLISVVTDETGTGSLVFSNTPTLITPILGAATASSLTGIAGGDLVLNSPVGQNVVLQNNGTTTETITSTGVTLASGKSFVLTNNGQTVTQQASPTATTSYTITYPTVAPTASTALTFDGVNYSWGQAGGWTVGSSLALTGGETIAISVTAGQQVFVVSSAGGDVTLAAAAFGATDPVNGAAVRLIGTSDTNTVSLVDSDTANGLRLNGSATLVAGSVIEFQYILSSDRWFETSRNF